MDIAIRCGFAFFSHVLSARIPTARVRKRRKPRRWRTLVNSQLACTVASPFGSLLGSQLEASPCRITDTPLPCYPIAVGYWRGKGGGRKGVAHIYRVVFSTFQLNSPIQPFPASTAPPIHSQFRPIGSSIVLDCWGVSAIFPIWGHLG